MDHAEALEIVVARTKVDRYRFLCGDENPDADSRDGYRRLMVDLAVGGAVPTPEDLALRADVEKHGGCCGGGIPAPAPRQPRRPTTWEAGRR